MAALDLPRVHDALRARSPLIQCITNTVVQQFSANVLLALRASPAMLDHEADAAQFAGFADGLLVNFGTASNQQLLAADVAIDIAQEQGKPWVLDPVSVGLADFRTRKIHQTLARQPTVVRGNASEILALAGMGQGGHGTDSRDEVQAALPAAVALARRYGSVIAISGAEDAVVALQGDGQVRIARVAGGHVLMTRVIGTGCSLGAAMAAYLACQSSTGADAVFAATVAAQAHFARAGSAAAQVTQAPGSFAVAFLDALHLLQPDDFSDVRLQVQTSSQEVWS